MFFGIILVGLLCFIITAFTLSHLYNKDCRRHEINNETEKSFHSYKKAQEMQYYGSAILFLTVIILLLASLWF